MTGHTTQIPTTSSNAPAFLLSQAGFTIIEITLALVLIGILSSVAIPKYFDLQNDARAKKCLHNQSVVSESLQVQAAIARLDPSGKSAEPDVLKVLQDLDSSCSGGNGKYVCPKLCEAGDHTYVVEKKALTTDAADGSFYYEIRCLEHGASAGATETAYQLPVAAGMLVALH